MRRPDYIPEGEEAQYGITPEAAPGGPAGAFKDWVPEEPSPPPVRHEPDKEAKWPNNVTAPRLPKDFYPGEAEAGPGAPAGEPEDEEDAPERVTAEVSATTARPSSLKEEPPSKKTALGLRQPERPKGTTPSTR